MKPANPDECRDLCLKKLELGPEIYNMAVRGTKRRHYKQRWALWWLMRQTVMLTGGVPSFPQIARATGMESHSCVVKGVQETSKEMQAAISSGIVPAIDRPLPTNTVKAAKMKGTK